MDHYADLRDEMTAALIAAGIEIERAHHEVGTAGQAEINYRFNTLTHAADDVLKFKYIVKNVAWANGKTATFMPKPLFGDNGSGHALPPVAVEGRRAAVLRRARLRRPVGHRALLHRRAAAPRAVAAGVHQPDRELLSPARAGLRGAGQPRLLAGNRSACIRIPITGTNPKAKRIEFRVPDPSGNPYLAFSAHADGRRRRHPNKIEPPAPIDKDLYELPPDEAAAIPQVPGSLDAVLDALEADNEFLLEGGVFTADLIETWIDYKRDQRDRPDPAAPAPARVRALLRRLTDVVTPKGPLTCTFTGSGAFSVALKSAGFHRDSGLLHDQVTGSVTRPDWPVWS